MEITRTGNREGTRKSPEGQYKHNYATYFSQARALKRHYISKVRPQPQTAPEAELADLERACEEVVEATAWDGVDIHQLVCNPIDTKHVLKGKDELISNGIDPKRQPKTKIRKIPYHTQLGLTTPYLQLLRVLDRCQVNQNITGVDDRLGPIMDTFLCEGTAYSDGQCSAITGHVAIALSATDANGHLAQHTITITSGEKKKDVHVQAEAANNGYRVLLDKMRERNPDAYADALTSKGVQAEYIEYALKVGYLRCSFFSRTTPPHTYISPSVPLSLSLYIYIDIYIYI